MAGFLSRFLSWAMRSDLNVKVLFNEPQVTAAVVIIGCPDYMRKCLISRASSSLILM